MSGANSLSCDLAALEWLLTSPPLLSQAACASVGARATVQRFSDDELAQIRLWLSAVRANPASFAAFMDTARERVRTSNAPGRLLDEPLRLGRLAERLLEFFLTFGPLHRLVASNLPIRICTRVQGLKSDRTTTGEIDFLLHNPTGEPLHWELAVKYFLCQATGESAQPSDFKGPDSAETFDYKLSKLLVRQLGHPAPEPHAGVAWRGQAVARGWMFYRFGQRVPQCHELAVDHLRGWWLPLAELAALDPSRRYVELARSRWMPPLRASHADVAELGLHNLAARLSHAWQAQADCKQPPHAFARIAKAQALGRQPSARLVAELMPDDRTADQWIEVARYFVLPS